MGKYLPLLIIFYSISGLARNDIKFDREGKVVSIKNGFFQISTDDLSDNVRSIESTVPNCTNCHIEFNMTADQNMQIQDQLEPEELLKLQEWHKTVW